MRTIYHLCGFLACSWFLGCQMQVEPDSSLAQVLPATMVAKPKLSRIDSLIQAQAISVAYLTGQFEPAADSLFIQIKPPLSVKPMYIRREAAQAYEQMQAAAAKDGIKLQITSATRNFSHQKSIWDSKWNSKKPVDGKKLPPLSKLGGKERALKILRWSAMPSTSRHHWGTDIDMNSADPKYWEKGKGLQTYQWLNAHAHEYGFCQTYSDFGQGRNSGYQVEKWHWSYLPLAKDFCEAYPKLISDSLIATFPFSGAEAAPEIGIIQNYVQGINQSCL